MARGGRSQVIVHPASDSVCSPQVNLTMPRGGWRRDVLLAPDDKGLLHRSLRWSLWLAPPACSALIVLVVAPPPDVGLVAPLGRAVEPLVHAPQGVQSARKGGIGVVDDAVLERERAHARALAPVSGRVNPACGRELCDGCRDLCRDD